MDIELRANSREVAFSEIRISIFRRYKVTVKLLLEAEEPTPPTRASRLVRIGGRWLTIGYTLRGRLGGVLRLVQSF